MTCRFFTIRSLFAVLFFNTLVLGSCGNAANYSEAEALYRAGKLAEAEEIAAAEVERGVWNRRWSELLIKCQMSTGKYADALETYDAAVKRYPTSLPLRALGIAVANYNGQPDKAGAEKAVIERYLQTGQLRFATSDTLVAAGRFFSKNGIDARIILKSFYDQVLENDATNLEALIATAELAVDKGDFAVAASTVERATARELSDARLSYLKAMALRSSDSQAAELALNQSLLENPVYEPALVLKAEKEIDREDYDRAEETIELMLKTNPHSPSAFALKAVLAHLEGDYERESSLRKRALRHWTTNPEVDHLIGRKLSDKYRFAEGAHYQRLALTFDPKHMPATFQLAQDLLRRGDDEVGWKLAEQVNTEDPYNVVAFNLMTLKDRMDGFETIRASEYELPDGASPSGDSSPDDSRPDPTIDGPTAAELRGDPGEILIRMDPRERKIYGAAAAKLLQEAKNVMCEKYALELTRPVIVEIFPKQSDFAIRTFGLPGGEGFLGVCFGHVITANSPASQGERPSNWKSVLWHEFCHVITLTKTNNRMPRWLSEGISVYEERLRDPRWGQSMTARYREMILGDDFTPVSRLSGAFLSPPSPTHLQFAYYESSLVVEYLVQEHGIEKLNAVLDALAEGIPMNAALAREIGPLERLEVGFAEYARKLAADFGSDLKFDRPELGEDASNAEKIEWARENLDNYWARMMLSQGTMAAGDFESATEHLEFLVEKQAATAEQQGVLESLATCYRELGKSEDEKATLEKLFRVSPDALPSLKRFIEMERIENNWESVLVAADRALEIQPFASGIHRAVADACRELGQSEKAIDSLLALQAMEPIDVAGLEFQLAESLAAAGDREGAIEHLVDALMIAPRYRDAHHLLVELHRPEEKAKEPEPEGEDEMSAENVEAEPGESLGTSDAGDQDKATTAAKVEDSE